MLRVSKDKPSTRRSFAGHSTYVSFREGSSFTEVKIMSIMKNVQPKAASKVPEQPIARFLFADTRMAWFWLIVRVYAGWQWLVWVLAYVYEDGLNVVEFRVVE